MRLTIHSDDQLVKLNFEVDALLLTDSPVVFSIWKVDVYESLGFGLRLLCGPVAA